VVGAGLQREGHQVPRSLPVRQHRAAANAPIPQGCGLVLDRGIRRCRRRQRRQWCCGSEARRPRGGGASRRKAIPSRAETGKATRPKVIRSCSRNDGRKAILPCGSDARRCAVAPRQDTIRRKAFAQCREAQGDRESTEVDRHPPGDGEEAKDGAKERRQEEDRRAQSGADPCEANCEASRQVRRKVGGTARTGEAARQIDLPARPLARCKPRCRKVI
jgi:hypothetical protein